MIRKSRRGSRPSARRTPTGRAGVRHDFQGRTLMGMLEGRVAIITGGARGLGREHALAFAREGPKVLVNDLGGSGAGEGADTTPADDVVAEIKALGGDAVANYEDVASWEGAERMVRTAVETFGGLHILVNNAGILRD